jgi:hypothetical protein
LPDGKLYADTNGQTGQLNVAGDKKWDTGHIIKAARTEDISGFSGLLRRVFALLFFGLPFHKYNFLGCHGFSVIVFLMQTLFGAVFNAHTAVYANKRITLPGGRLGVNGDALGWAFSGTGFAKDARLNLVIEFPPGIFKGFPGFLGVKPG